MSTDHDPLTDAELDLLDALNRARTPGPFAIAHDRHGQANIYGGPDGEEWIALLPHQCLASLEAAREADARAIREGGTIPLLRIPQDSMSQMIGVEEWHVLNQSANGLRMHRESGGNVSVTVGEIVGVRFVGGRTWNVGIVRWLTMLEGNALEFGVELVAPAAESISIEPTIGGGRANPALRLLSVVPEAESDTLVTTTIIMAVRLSIRKPTE